MGREKRLLRFDSTDRDFVHLNHVLSDGLLRLATMGVEGICPERSVADFCEECDLSPAMIAMAKVGIIFIYSPHNYAPEMASAY